MQGKQKTLYAFLFVVQGCACLFFLTLGAAAGHLMAMLLWMGQRHKTSQVTACQD